MAFDASGRGHLSVCFGQKLESCRAQVFDCEGKYHAVRGFGKKAHRVRSRRAFHAIDDAFYVLCVRDLFSRVRGHVYLFHEQT